MKRFCLALLSLVTVFSCTHPETTSIDTGVSYELATDRKAKLNDIKYVLDFEIPADRAQPIDAGLVLGFKLQEADEDLILDFSAGAEKLKSMAVNEEPIEVLYSNEHVIIPAKYLQEGYNEVSIDFVAGDAALNRNVDYMYTLFVPDKASSAFPCFDQPDLKASFELHLTIPEGWNYMANMPIQQETELDGAKQVHFEASGPLSTYLFSFVAGDFEYEILSDGGFEMTILHREVADEQLTKNLKEILDLHKQSVIWMEKYTGIKYPFKKFGISAIPGFQFGGMEHPGVIHYRSSLLMLEEPSTLEAKLSRAGVIAHETAHMWFGNLVTMKWFDDVWMKEVFANFMADKIVKEMYPDMNHDLVFMYDHYPRAYAVDRTAGSTPIRQELANLNEAANMYGDIIYHKAPIMMRQLEMKIGDRVLQASLRDYLESFANSNADWEDLIGIIERVSNQDLGTFNQSWVYESGMPFFELKENRTEYKFDYEIVEHDPAGKGRLLPQVFDVRFTDDLGFLNEHIQMNDSNHIFPQRPDYEGPKFILQNATGTGYGVFSHGADYIRQEFLFHRARVDISRYEDDLVRGSAYINLHEYLLQEGFHPELYFYFLQNYLKEEKSEIIVEYLLSVMNQVYFRFFNQEIREKNVSNLETVLLEKIVASESAAMKSALFNSYIGMAASEEALTRLKGYWEKQGLPGGVDVSQRQEESIALKIALLDSADGAAYIDRQIERMDNADRIARLKFIKPAVSHDPEVRDRFFESLKSVENRGREPWVLAALGYLHHPFRQEASIAYLKASLEILPELQQTGGIFFPKGWLDKTLEGYQSTEAANIIRVYLETAELSPHLRKKLLQSADMVYRSEENLNWYLESE